MRQVVRITNPHAPAAAGLGHQAMVDVDKMAGAGVAAEFHRFGIPLETEYPIVQKYDQQRDIASHHRLDLGPAMGKTTVTDESDDWFVRFGKFGAHRQRQSPSETGETARTEEPHAG